MKISSALRTFGLLALFAAACADEGRPTTGLQVLAGEAARGYVAPSDVVFERWSPPGRNGLGVERSIQLLDGVEVFGATTSTIYDVDGVPTAVVAKHFPELSPANAIVLSAEAAIGRATPALADGASRSARLYVHPATGRFFYEIDARGDGFRTTSWIDAESGRVWRTFDTLTTDHGIGVDGDRKDLTNLVSGTGPYSLHSTRIETHDQGSSKKPFLGPIASDTDGHWDLPGFKSPGQPALVDTHYYLDVADDYLQAVHGFDFVTRYGKRITAHAHYQSAYNNAFWNGSYFAFGDGDQVSYREFGVLDVAAHELTHAVTEKLNGLVYQGESGALNEAFSDMVGTTVEFQAAATDPAHTPDWKMGEDLAITSDGFRDMADPEADGDPDHYSERYTGTSDNGGVHINSGIANHAFYLASVGGVNASCAPGAGPHGVGHCAAPQSEVIGLGIAQAMGIFYTGFTTLSATAPFCEARQATVAAATATDAASIAAAWDAVGVEVCPVVACGDGTCSVGEACESDCGTCGGATDACATTSECCPGLTCGGRRGAKTCR